MSTAILMELGDVVLKQLEHIKTVDFTKTTTTVSLFETTVCAHKNFKTPPREAIAYQDQIRYLGGLLSGHDLLTGPYKDLLPKA